jgi:GT2 family glycosyltransferase
MTQLADRQMTYTPLIVTVILNTNRREDTLACLRSLQKNTYPNQCVIVLDNASNDGSVEVIETEFPAVQVLPLTNNLGYAGNNNVGIDAAMDMGADWVFVLNEDTTLAPDCLEQMIAAAQSQPKAGIIGPLVYHFDEPTVIQSAGGSLDGRWRSKHIGQNEPDRGQYTSVQAVDWISGCAILVRREVIEQVGGLDERFFYYWEETDWCRRAAEAGWVILLAPQAQLWHKGVQRNYEPPPNVTYYATRNRLLFLRKHAAPAVVWGAVLFDNIRTLASWTVRPKWRAMHAHRDAMWQGLRDFFGSHWGMRRV